MSKFASMLRAKVETVIAEYEAAIAEYEAAIAEYEALVKERRVLKAIEKCTCTSPGSIRDRLCSRCIRSAQIRNKIANLVWEWLRGEGDGDWSGDY